MWKQDVKERQARVRAMPLNTVEDAVARVKQTISNEGIDWVTQVRRDDDDRVLVIAPTYGEYGQFRVRHESCMKTAAGKFKLEILTCLVCLGEEKFLS